MGIDLPLIADIKRNALDDGPGIRTTVFFKGCPLSCVWCHNPECISAAPELLFRQARCIDCRDCAAACTQGAIGAAGPSQLDRARCKRSADCVEACPGGALEIVGRRYSVDELTELLLRDRVFFDNSGGGVSLSGGEATLFSEFAGAVAQRLSEQSIHVLLQTCGHFKWERFASLLAPHLDTIYFDVKLADPEEHHHFCGRDNALIVENLARLRALDVEVLVRVPLVPQVNCERDKLASIATLLRSLGVDRVALLAYNPLWGSKLASLGRKAGHLPERFLDPAQLEMARKVFSGFSIVQ